MEIQLWRSILCPYELAVRELEVKFNHIIDECKENDVYCPIEQVEGRVKSVSSILEKMQRKHIPMERMEEELEDIAGVRIICQFEEDIETVASLIQKRSDMVIKSEKNYLKHIKQSGYRSYHLIIYYTVDTIKGPKKLQAEIQIRTMAMNFWATIEHSLQYKYKGDMPEHVAERLSKAADAINALDHEMSSVRNEIMDAQNSSQMQSNLVKDILINIENLYKIANKREIMKIQDEFLREEAREKGIVGLSDIPTVKEQYGSSALFGDRISIWQGDITRLQVDAIVNAANSRMLGCFVPCHGCIDNAIHSAAGIQLRNECARMMEEQGHEEPTGKAKITQGYNLPASHVIHTVGPIVGLEVTQRQKEELKSCYLSCMKLAEKEGLKSIAFCCISTGEFHFPNKLAAQIAVETVDRYLSSSKLERVIFNVFKEEDYNIYKKLLQ